jgi:hypothetical protein
MVYCEARRTNLGLFRISILIVSADVAVLNVKPEKIHSIKVTPDYSIDYVVDVRVASGDDCVGRRVAFPRQTRTP